MSISPKVGVLDRRNFLSDTNNRIQANSGCPRHFGDRRCGPCLLSSTALVCCSFYDSVYWLPNGMLLCCARTRVKRLNVIQAVYALTLPWSLSSSSIATMALFQHASTTLRQSMESLRGSQFPASVTETMHQIRRFYEALDYNNNVDKAVNYPSHLSCSKGMRVSFRWALCDWLTVG